MVRKISQIRTNLFKNKEMYNTYIPLLEYDKTSTSFFNYCSALDFMIKDTVVM